MARLQINKLTGDFYEKGFLGEEIQQFKSSVRQHYQGFFVLFEELNAYSRDNRTRVTVDGRDDRRGTAASVFARMLTGAQSVYILSTYGLSYDARVVLRSILDALFVLTNIAKDSTFVNRYIGEEVLSREKRIRTARDAKYSQDSTINREASDELIRHLRKSIEENHLGWLRADQLAKDVEMEIHYDGLYRNLSDYVHSSFASLRTISASSTSAIDCIPRFSEIPDNLAIAMDFVLRGWHRISELFELDMNRELQPYRERLLTLYEEFEIQCT